LLGPWGELDVVVHASFHERAGRDRGHNTAVCVDRSGRVLTRTRTTHIPDLPHHHENL
jgi:predicted amidohydrolase